MWPERARCMSKIRSRRPDSGNVPDTKAPKAGFFWCWPVEDDRGCGTENFGVKPACGCCRALLAQTVNGEKRPVHNNIRVAMVAPKEETTAAGFRKRSAAVLYRRVRRGIQIQWHIRPRGRDPLPRHNTWPEEAIEKPAGKGICWDLG